MKKLVILAVAFLGLAAFVYFYEIVGKEARDKARELEEKLLRLDQDAIVNLEIRRTGQDPVVFKKEEDSWMLEQPLKTKADQASVDSFLRSLDNARRERIFDEEDSELGPYGLAEPIAEISVATAEEAKVLLLGNKDFTGNQLYVKFSDDPSVLITSSSLLTSSDKELLDWRSKKALEFERSRVEAIQITRPSGEIRLAKKEDDWNLESPIQERADSSTVNSLLSTLEFANAQEFVSETAESLQDYGLDQPGVVVQLREEGEDAWRRLELGRLEGETYYARDPQRSPVFTLNKDLYDKLVEELWSFRDKDVVNVPQDQIATLKLVRGQDEIALRRDDYKWIVESPEEFKDKEAMSYKIWYPIDDVKYTAVTESGPELPDAATEVVLIQEDGTESRFRFAEVEGKYYALQVQSGRMGTIAREDFEKLQVNASEIVEQ